ncbi:MAG: response regulator receiver protein [Bryobacterales bacterium]|nr:response regulator receiver protein [Bryobacterales bacterium]
MSKTILIVEDNESCVTTLEISILSIPGVKVRSVGTAREALTVLLEGNVDAMLTDLHLPRVDGFELIAQVRSNPGYARMPIIVISGDSDPRTPERVRRAGADAHFVKPYSPVEIRKTLEQFLYAH